GGGGAGRRGQRRARGRPAGGETLPLPLEQAYRHASEVMVRNAGTADAREGMSAFLDKREPEWSHGRPPA
ncbi:MAG TPA: hypothetical protein PKD59_06975, partial [Miltoncostaeaceae bacterium]|nr:hypothetical protein [Miltoncostaeaceae bacterium]